MTTTAEASRAPGPGRRPGAVNVLELRSIYKSFGAVAALSDVELDVTLGEVVALEGGALGGRRQRR